MSGLTTAAKAGSILIPAVLICGAALWALLDRPARAIPPMPASKAPISFYFKPIPRMTPAESAAHKAGIEAAKKLRQQHQDELNRLRARPLNNPPPRVVPRPAGQWRTA